MKTLPICYKQNTDTVEAYQKADIDGFMKYVFRQAEQLWYDEWVAQGEKDEGSCTGGKGLQIWYAGPRKQSADLATVVQAPPCQGNLSAERSSKTAIEYLKHNGVDVKYYDGWMN